MKYYLGIDNGGTSTKAALYTKDGEELCVRQKETEMLVPSPGGRVGAGFAERDMESMWEANCEIIREVLNTSGVNPADIAGAACCGHGKGLYIWGKDGGPVRPGILSADSRAWEYPLKWKADGTAAKVFELSCQDIMACQPVSLLAWLKDHEPEIQKRIQWVFECKDYIRFRLTGEARGEITDYSGANLLNLKTRQYDRELLRLFGLEEIFDKLPPLCLSTEVCGHVSKYAAEKSGLAEGTPVAGGMFDIDACAIAAGVVSEDKICMIAGTWSINEYIRREAVTDGSAAMNSIFCIPGYYLIEESSATSAGNYEWFINTLLPELKEQADAQGRTIFDICDKEAESIPVDEFVPIFLPFLMASNVHPNAKAVFVGMSRYHKRAHIIRSVYEGIAFCHRYHLDKLTASRPSPAESIRLAGGASRSKVWTRMFADITGYPVEAAEHGEAGTLGCAMAAAVAAGEYKDLAEAVKRMAAFREAVMPAPERSAAYEGRYRIYKRVIEALDPLWDDIRKLSAASSTIGK
ncbi:MAG: carbohydrate kinase [Clostridiales bacterium]|jgi:L-xylulokinase|nr:carbohydrate kinase [Clostridiales bacterium]